MDTITRFCESATVALVVKVEVECTAVVQDRCEVD